MTADQQPEDLTTYLLAEVRRLNRALNELRTLAGLEPTGRTTPTRIETVDGAVARVLQPVLDQVNTALRDLGTAVTRPLVGRTRSVKIVHRTPAGAIDYVEDVDLEATR